MIRREGSSIRVQPVGPLDGRIRPIGSKSLTNRALICAALGDGHCALAGASLADDARVLIEALRTLGIEIEVAPTPARVDVQGCRGLLPAADVRLDAGPAGTAMRFLTALSALGFGRYEIDGSPRMRQRPIGELVGALNQLGAAIGYAGVEGYPPVAMVSRGLVGGQVAFGPLPSSQFVSAVLMVAPYAANDVLIRVDGDLPSRPYVDMTIHLMRQMGVEVLGGHDARFIVPSGQRYAAHALEIEPDASAATYFWAAAALTGGRVTVAGLSRGSWQGDVQFVDVLGEMGCQVEHTVDSLTVQGPPDGRLRGIDVDLNAMPDTVQTLAVVALFADGPTTIRNVANLRIKETDRLAALGAELSRLGGRVELLEDGLTVTPPSSPSAAAIHTWEDHRMAMSFALAGLRTPGIVIRDADCVSKSYPDFFEDLAALGGN